MNPQERVVAFLWWAKLGKPLLVIYIDALFNVRLQASTEIFEEAAYQIGPFWSDFDVPALHFGQDIANNCNISPKLGKANITKRSAYFFVGILLIGAIPYGV